MIQIKVIQVDTGRVETSTFKNIFKGPSQGPYFMRGLL